MFNCLLNLIRIIRLDLGEQNRHSVGLAPCSSLGTLFWWLRDWKKSSLTMKKELVSHSSYERD